jgi:hypothetical protein
MPEAFAVAKLAQSYQSGDTSAQNTAAITPTIIPFQVVPQKAA